MNRFVLAVSIAVSLISAPARAALVLQQGDGPTPAVYANGGGGGFGGMLGNSSISMDVVGTDLVINYAQSGNNNDNNIVVLYLDTRPGGFTDAQMFDHLDDGRAAITDLTQNDNDLFPILPDFALAMDNFGTGVFELNAGILNFINPYFGGVHTATIPLATLGNPVYIDFFAALVSRSNYGSNESLPYTTAGINQGGNPGFGGGNTNLYDNFNRFVTHPIPEASAFMVWGLILATAGLIRRRRT